MRLTIKGYDYREPMANKLSQLEDFEEERGIKLITLFQALKNGIYYKDYYDHIYFERPEHLSIGLNGLVYAYTDDFDDDIRGEHRYNEYRVTWALTREELTTRNR